jgi:hypothetical protein
MAAVPPSDSAATGNVTITTGPLSTQGTVTILTKGLTETSVQYQMPDNSWTLISSNGQANKVESSQTVAYPLEFAASSRCVYFPLPYLAGILSNPDYSILFVGKETLGSAAVFHIAVQNTFVSSPKYQFLSPFTLAEIWFDAATGLPKQISYNRQSGRGASPKILISVSYSNYQVVSGVLHPFTIEESVNGTLWATTSIQSVTFNTGLTETNFPISAAGN